MDRPTRASGTPVGHILGRVQAARVSHEASAANSPLPRPSKLDGFLLSDSEGSAQTISASPSPLAARELDSMPKPKPSVAPHLLISSTVTSDANASVPTDLQALEPHPAAPSEGDPFGTDIDYSLFKRRSSPHEELFSISPKVQPKSRACAEMLVRAGFRCATCFQKKLECLCSEKLRSVSLPVFLVSEQCIFVQVLLPQPQMGQSSRFQQGVPVLRLHASDSEGSLPSIASSGFAQVVREDFRFFPDSDADSPGNARSSLSSHPEALGLRYRYPPQFQPIDVRPRFMYSIGLSNITAGPAAEARMPISSQDLAGVLLGAQSCANILLCLDHVDWFHVVQCSRACHDCISEQASASVLPLPSDNPCMSLAGQGCLPHRPNSMPRPQHSI